MAKPYTPGEKMKKLTTLALTALFSIVAVAQDKPSYNFDAEFDWSKIPQSSANIGKFPYIALPKAMKIEGGEKNKPYSEFWDFNQLIMFDGKNVYFAEGKRAFIAAEMEDDNTDFNQFLFDKSVEKYLKKIGAVEIFSGKIPSAVTDKLNQKDDLTVHNYITGDIWNEASRQYALNHVNTRVFFQVLSHSATGEIGVVELEDFQQTIKVPTATEIKKQIDTDGKAVLQINFDTNKAIIKSESLPIVEQIFLLLQQYPEMKLSIEGHTDSTGDTKSNMTLSKKRANTVMYALAGKGIEIERLSSKGFGDTKPMVKNDSEANKAKNRRVELIKR